MARLCFPHGVDGATINTRARASDQTHCIHTAQGTSRTTKNREEPPSMRVTPHFAYPGFRGFTFPIPRISGFYISYGQNQWFHIPDTQDVGVLRSRYPGFQDFTLRVDFRRDAMEQQKQWVYEESSCAAVVPRRHLVRQCPDRAYEWEFVKRTHTPEPCLGPRNKLHHKFFWR